jgi:hypothetical protein
MEKIGKEKVRMQENTQAQFIHNQGFSLPFFGLENWVQVFVWLML